MTVLSGYSDQGELLALTLLVDNNANDIGQDAAARCARRWVDAARQVIRLTPRALGADFNDIVTAGKRHERR